MRRVILGLGVVGLVVLVGFVLAPVPAQAGDKVTICHFPGHGNQSPMSKGDYIDFKDDGRCEASGGNTITISVNALPAHGIVPCDPGVEKCATGGDRFGG